jgi:hypothetical protein
MRRNEDPDCESLTLLSLSYRGRGTEKIESGLGNLYSYAPIMYKRRSGLRIVLASNFFKIPNRAAS